MRWAAAAVLVMLTGGQALAVDCEMARRVAASYSKAELRTMGTPAQRAEYAPCFRHPLKTRAGARRHGRR